MSLCVDPDTLHRLIESDYESGDTAYPNLMRLFSEGKIAPCLTTPFHAILPMLASEAEMRLCIRSGLILYLRIIRNYSDFLAKNGEGGLMVMPVWLPEGGYSQKILQILRQEFDEVCKKEKLGRGHLVLMLDNQQAEFAENDVLMKSWNQLEVEPAQGDSAPKSKRVRDSLKGLHEGVGNVTVLFRDRAFSDWVIHANPSVKKLLDRTIAKVDSDINMQNVHYGWAHFEELEAITYSPRAIVNFQQKLVKLTELGYLPLFARLLHAGQTAWGVRLHDARASKGQCAGGQRWQQLGPGAAHGLQPLAGAPQRYVGPCSTGGQPSL